MFGAPRLVPLPRRPLDESCRVRRWYENELGWPTVPGDPLRLVVGVRYDVLDVPSEAGHAALRRLAPASPVAVLGDRMRFLVAAGTAEELSGLLEWLEWGTLPLDLTAIGAGDTMQAPRPPGVNTPGGPAPFGERGGTLPRESDSLLPCETGGALFPEPGFCRGRPLPLGRFGSQGAAVWLRPPEPGCEVEASLPTLSALGGGGDAPDLVRLVNTVATQCHRVRLRRTRAQPPALRAQGR